MEFELPSEVKDRNYLYMPLQKKVVESDEEWSKCGKWILTNFTENMSWIDETWINLRVLVENGALLMIKASTVATENCPGFPGTILCYTRPGVEEIKRAAEAIRKTISYESCMYYKINRATENGISKFSGYTHIANYLHTFRGLLYEQDEIIGWKLVTDSDNKNLRPPLSLEKAKLFLNLDQHFLHPLPSKTRKMFLKVKDKLKVWHNTCSNLYIYSVCTMEKKEYDLTDADKLWIIGNKMMESGYFNKVTCLKDRQLPSMKIIAKFRFFCGSFCLNQKQSTSLFESVVELCDILRREAHYYKFVYFETPDNKHYTYSPDGELYEDGIFVFK